MLKKFAGWLALIVTAGLLLAFSVCFLLFPALGIQLPFCLPSIQWGCPEEGASASTSVGAISSAPVQNTGEETVPQAHPADPLLEQMTLEEKVGQLFFARCPDTGALEEIQLLHPAGYVLFGRDFEGQTPDSVRSTIASYQQVSEIPLLIGVDEEGGSVVRVSRYEAFRRWPFQSPQELFEEDGSAAFVYDTAEKDRLLADLGINVNLAPVCDVSTDPDDYMYDRTLGQDAEATAEYVRITVEQMVHDNMGAVLKHFPGYGPNDNTHDGIATDTRSLDSYYASDFLPFQAGIAAGAGAVLVSHLIVECMDDRAPASLSAAVHDILRTALDFDGVVMTDDLSMEAIGAFAGDTDAAVLAIQAGNDLLISSDFATQHQAVVDAVRNGVLTEAQIDEHVRRVLDWKQSLGLLSFEDTTTQQDWENAA